MIALVHFVTCVVSTMLLPCHTIVVLVSATSEVLPEAMAMTQK